ncbi:MAG TPA: hypothetical protein VG738_06880 [Chitinophagaceae bacterium]|nr:hypothetical protein [Chitinophagaceae bacterium]
MKKVFTLVLITACCTRAFSQNIPLAQQVQKRFNKMVLNADTSVFTGFRATDWLEYKSFLSSQKTQVTDSAFGLSSGAPGGYFFKQLSTNNWVQANGNNSIFALDPYINAAFGKSKEQSNALYEISAGLRLQGTVNDKISYGLGYVYTNSKFPNYLNTYLASNQGYGLGMAKGTLQNNGAYSFSNITGYFTYIPNRHFLVSIGNGKNFIGDGYRSLILSDNSANYPYIRLQARFWKLTYNALYAEFDNPRYLIDGNNQRKYSVMHYLGANFSKRFQLGVFDNVIWYSRDTTINRGFDVQYLNPFIFTRPLEFGIGSPDNAFMGLTFKYILYKKGFLYGQIALDDLHITESVKNHAQHFGDKYGIQLGLWNEDIFNVKELSWRVEFNSVRPYTYTHGFDKAGLNYTHANQALADPFGANFNELISIFQYNNKRWFGMFENIYTVRGEQPAGLGYPIGYDLWGGDLSDYPTAPVYGSKTTQGVKNHYFYNQASLGYLINPRNRLALQGDVIYRRHTAPDLVSSDFYFTIGIKTGLYNFYKDF